jgi:death-on-curing protein
MEPEFLEITDVLRIHEDQVLTYGGSTQLRDAGLLASAVAMPRASSGGVYLHADLIEMAGAYLFHLVSNHPFIDGNKRVGTVAALVFLDLNGIETEIDDDELADLVLALARSEIGKAEVVSFLRKHAVGPTNL